MVWERTFVLHASSFPAFSTSIVTSPQTFPAERQKTRSAREGEGASVRFRSRIHPPSPSPIQPSRTHSALSLSLSLYISLSLSIFPDAEPKTSFNAHGSVATFGIQPKKGRRPWHSQSKTISEIYTTVCSIWRNRCWNLC